MIKDHCHKFFVCYITEGEYDAEHIYIIFEYESTYKMSNDVKVIINEQMIENLYEGLFVFA